VKRADSSPSAPDAGTLARDGCGSARRGYAQQGYRKLRTGEAETKRTRARQRPGHREAAAADRGTGHGDPQDARGRPVLLRCPRPYLRGARMVRNPSAGVHGSAADPQSLTSRAGAPHLRVALQRAPAALARPAGADLLRPSPALRHLRSEPGPPPRPTRRAHSRLRDSSVIMAGSNNRHSQARHPRARSCQAAASLRLGQARSSK
jgi:hypothetical protein